MEKPALVNAALQQWLDGLDRVTGG
jgi:hypothetical protein